MEEHELKDKVIQHLIDEDNFLNAPQIKKDMNLEIDVHILNSYLEVGVNLRGNQNKNNQKDSQSLINVGTN